jgi:hypothetical protein
MKMNAASALKLARLPFGAGRTPAVLLLSGASKDPSTGNWTTTYVVDNRLGKAIVNQVNILVDSVRENVDLQPTQHTEPTDWIFDVALGGRQSSGKRIRDFLVVVQRRGGGSRHHVAAIFGDLAVALGRRQGAVPGQQLFPVQPYFRCGVRRNRGIWLAACARLRP